VKISEIYVSNAKILQWFLFTNDIAELCIFFFCCDDWIQIL